MARKLVLLSLLLAALLAAMAATPLLVRPPDVSAAGDFDTRRAAARLQRILGDQRPHPADTAASDFVRQRLLAEIRAIGLTPQVQDQVACNQLYKYRGVSCARVRNVLVTIGPAAGKNLLLNAHYDSSIAGPGAGDDGAGVATLLEVAAILKDAALGRPVTFLFNEGEELGLIGARAFLERNPLAERVDSLINLEARGTTGPVAMFETSVPNAAPVRTFARVVDRPVANSLATDAYRQLPNATDVNTFEERDWLTLNFAMIGNETRYHSPGDRFEALDLRSLQHMGDQALGVARALGGGTQEAGGQLLFMDVASRFLVRLPVPAGVVLLVAELLLFGWLCVRRKCLGRGTATVMVALVLATALAWAGTALLDSLRAGMFWRAYPLWTQLAVYASALAAALAMLATLGRKLDVRRMRVAFWFAFLLVGGAVALIAPGGMVYFLLPPLAVAIGLLAGRWFRWGEAAGALIAALVLYLTMGAMLAMLQEMLNSGPMWLFAPLGLLVMLAVIVEAKPLLQGLSRSAAIAAGAVAMLAGWTAAAAAPAYSADRQQRFAIEYVGDAGTGRAYWAIANDGAPLPAAFGEGWGRRELPDSPRLRWVRRAPLLPNVAPPVLEPVGSETTRKDRQLTFRLRSNGALSVLLIAPENAEIHAAGTPGSLRPIDVAGTEGDYALRCTGRSCDGMLLQLVTSAKEPIEAKLVGVAPGLPPQAKPLLAARPVLARPQYTADAVVTVRRVRF